MVNLSEKISSLRKAHNLTQEALGESVGVSAQAVSKWEKGDSLPDISVIPDICKTFGISADALLGNESSMSAEVYLDKALSVCKDTDERMRLLHKVIVSSIDVKPAADSQYLFSLLFDAHAFTIADGRGFGMFFNSMPYIKKMLDVNFSSNRMLKLLSDEKAIRVFLLICINGILTESEIVKITGYTEQEVDDKIFALMKCSTIEPAMGTINSTNAMGYSMCCHHGVSLLGIITNLFLTEPESRMNITQQGATRNSNPNMLRKFLD